MIKELKPFKGEIWKKNVWEKIAENLDFEQHSNFISVHSKSTFAQDFRVLIPPPPLFALVRFRAPPPPPKVRSFWVELFLPSLNFYTCEI